MDFLKNIFDNELIKKAAFGQLRKLCKENNLSAVLIVYNKEKDDFDFQLMKEDQTVIPTADLEEMKKAYLATFK